MFAEYVWVPTNVTLRAPPGLQPTPSAAPFLWMGPDTVLRAALRLTVAPVAGTVTEPGVTGRLGLPRPLTRTAYVPGGTGPANLHSGVVQVKRRRSSPPGASGPPVRWTPPEQGVGGFTPFTVSLPERVGSATSSTI